jgi:DNA-binding response OmpR family regulator
MRILLLNLGSESSEAVKHAVSGQGYDIAADRSLTIDQILARSPELLITEATPSDLSCCGLISQITASSGLPALKIVMIVHGDALERARGLDLGADDVVSFPFEPLEFGAKIRTQLRQRQPELKLEAELKDALEREHMDFSRKKNSCAVRHRLVIPRLQALGREVATHWRPKATRFANKWQRRAPQITKPSKDSFKRRKMS